MEDFVYIGKIVNTHGIKGEVRLMSKFSKKEKVFIKGMTIYVGRNKEKCIITGYRKHKCFDMITLDGYYNINDVLKFKGALVYVNRCDLNMMDEEYLPSDLINLPVYRNDEKIATVIELEEITDKNSVLWIFYNDKKVAIPFNDNFVKVDIKNKKVNINVIEGML